MKNLFFCLLLMSVACFSLQAQTDVATRKKHFNLDNGVAVQGYDVVSYLDDNRAEEGKKDFQRTHQGVIYYFKNAAHLATFKQNPDKYEPAYGGWCAYGIGEGNYKIGIDPETFKIVNGKIYLFYNRFLTNALTLWNKQETTLKSKAEINWKNLVK